MPRSGATTLSDVLSPTLTLACVACHRRGVYSVARLRDKHGDPGLPDLRAFLSADCPKHVSHQNMDMCEARFDPPPEIRQEKPRWS